MCDNLYLGMAYKHDYKGLGKGAQYTQEQKIEVVTHFLSCGSQTETLRKFKISANSLYKWRDQFAEYVKGATQESIVKKQAEIARVKVEYNKDANLQGILDVQKKAVDRIIELIPTEKDLNKVINVLLATLRVTNPEKGVGDDKSINQYNISNIIERANQKLTNGTSKG